MSKFIFFVFMAVAKGIDGVRAVTQIKFEPCASCFTTASMRISDEICRRYKTRRRKFKGG